MVHNQSKHSLKVINKLVLVIFFIIGSYLFLLSGATNSKRARAADTDTTSTTLQKPYAQPELNDPVKAKAYVDHVVDTTPGVESLSKDQQAALKKEFEEMIKPNSYTSFGDNAQRMALTQKLNSSYLAMQAKQAQTNLNASYAANDQTTNGILSKYVYAQEWKPDTSAGPDELQDDGHGHLYLTGRSKKDGDKDYTDGLAQVEFTTPNYPWQNNNDFQVLSFMYLTINGSIADKGKFDVGYISNSKNEPYLNGKMQMSGTLPINANISSLRFLVPQANFLAGNYGAYVRIQVPAGVDANSFVKTIDWNQTGGSSQFNINVLGLHIPLVDNFISKYGGLVHFPLTWFPKYTQVTKEDPTAFYVALGGVPTAQTVFNNVGVESPVGGPVVNVPIQAANNVFIHLLIGLASASLGNLSGRAAGWLTFDMGRYGGNYSSNELDQLGYSRTKNKDLYAGADDSPNKVITKGSLPPNPSNIWEENYTAYMSNALLAKKKDEIFRLAPMMGDKGWLNAAINRNEIKGNNVETNSLKTWSTYFAPIDNNHTAYTGNVLDQYTNSADHDNASYNVKNQLDSNNQYKTGEFQEVQDPTDPNFGYHYVLDGPNFRRRSITTYYDKDGFFSKYDQKRFFRVLDYFNKKVITNASTTKMDPLTTEDPDTGAYVGPNDFKQFMNTHFNRTLKVFYNGTSNSSDGTKPGSPINLGPINTNYIAVTQWVKPSTISWSGTSDTTRNVTTGVNTSQLLSGIIYSKDAWNAKMYYRIDDGKWQQFAPLDNTDAITTPTVSNGNTNGPGPIGDKNFDINGTPNWRLMLKFKDSGTYKVDIKATDNFGVDSTTGTPDHQQPGVLTYNVKVGNGYNINRKYVQTSNNQPIKYPDTGQEVTVKPFFADTSASSTVNFPVFDSRMEGVLDSQQRQELGVEYHLDYVTLDDPKATKHYGAYDTIQIPNISHDHTVYYHYTPITLTLSEVPTGINFGKRALPRTGQKPTFLPRKVAGHLTVTTFPGVDDSWKLTVKSNNLMKDNVYEDFPVANALYYYSDPKTSTMLSQDTPAVVEDTTDSRRPMPPKTTEQDGDTTKTIYHLDDDWITSDRGNSDDVANNTKFKSGFVLKPESKPFAELHQNVYKGDMTWTLTNSID
ncbi:hypothetical protein ACNAN0_10360 [Agrilactobacillus fermenti]|uniref:hypothetical protein n=1 Tax=Agrilactobacillus fermenti TaxID=2586909 RepID=UPI003A5C4E0E